MFAYNKEGMRVPGGLGELRSQEPHCDIELNQMRSENAGEDVNRQVERTTWGC
jgi:hypothetical protein